MQDNVRNLFLNRKSLSSRIEPRPGLSTTNNERFLRFWHEVNFSTIKLNCKNKIEAQQSNLKWFPFNKGGDYRKWFGNNDFIVNWKNDGAEIKKAAEGASGGRVVSEEFYFRESLSVSAITSSENSYRFYPAGAIFDVNFRSYFDSDNNFIMGLLGFLNSNVVNYLIKYLSPTLALNKKDLDKLPIFEDYNVNTKIITSLINFSKIDWNNYETSWDFTENPLIRQKQPTLKAAFEQWQTQNRAAIDEMKRLEEENNRLFIDAYGLQDELTPDVPEEQITLVRADREKDCRDFISYAVGCLFGRYSLDKMGLILASQGETLADYLKQITEPTLIPCENNVLPIIDGDWFADDISERFREFLRVSFGEAHYEENLHFIEESLGKKIGQYFVKDFYSDHIKRYKKRPIYWLFSSPKGSFNALIYLHRYRVDTVSVVLNEYLREFRTKLSAQKSHLEAMSISSNASQSEKTKALKEIEKINKTIAELEEYEREVLYPLATEQKVIDLDDGVKVNYCKFGTALKKIAGLDAQDD
jgi:hypothetical protein